MGVGKDKRNSNPSFNEYLHSVSHTFCLEHLSPPGTLSDVNCEYWNETHFYGDFQTGRDGRRIRPHKNNLLSFDTKDDHIEVQCRFAFKSISKLAFLSP
ncbi:hypothetical protein Bhyg_11999 [Pseudolycoriella hygida]|uniref:Uncharacterized protein n=1 Tax=Pseudolycoriella hygida TaxID=35572 RepID=A0A9Q0S017_9DIPT|nr:hypothetical protein Bhyg_11999 [Pseudolycoriella hygida]